MKLYKILILAPALGVVIPATATAQDAQDTIEVRATTPMIEWQRETSADLDRALSRIGYAYGESPNEAIVQVAFQIGANGKAEDAHVLPGSGNAAANHIAVSAVRRLSTLDDIPLASAGGRPVLANIIFYDTVSARKRMEAQLAKSERLRLSSNSALSRYVAIGVSPVIAGTR